MRIEPENPQSWITLAAVTARLLRQEVEKLVRASILAGRFLPEEPGTNGLPAAPAGTTKTASSALALPAAPGPEKAGDLPSRALRTRAQ